MQQAQPTPRSGQPAPAQAGTPNAAAAGQLRLGGELDVNRLGFGAMRITGDGIWGEPRDPAESVRVLRRAVELGVNFIDTADSYGPEVSERLIAEALHPYPPELVIATKGGLLRPGPNQWTPDGRPEHLRAVLRGSLQRLRVERIDLYQLHRPDPKVPLEESLGALVAEQQAGRIRFIGISNVTVEELGRARKVARVVSVQNRFNLDDQASSAVLDVCQRTGIAFIPWAPVKARSPALETVAQRHGVSPTEIAIAWLLQRSPLMLPIPGTSSVAHLEANVRAASLRLTREDLDELSRKH